MTSLGVFVGIKTQNLQYLWKVLRNAMDTWHVHLTT